MILAITSVTQIGPATIRVGFDTTGYKPLAHDRNEFNDGLNISNWVFSGSGSPKTQQVKTVSGNPYCLDVITDKVFLGSLNYTLSVGTVTSANGTALTGESIFTFSTIDPQQFFSTAPVQSAEDVVRQNLNAVFQGPGWDAWVAAIGYSDQKLQQLSQAAFYQKFISSAGEVYLDRLAAGENVDRPPNSGMDDDTLRKLTIGLKANKVNTVGLEVVLEAYYGINGTRAQINSTTAQTWNLSDNDDLVMEIDYVPITFTIHSSQFRDIAQATATELSAVLNDTLQENKINAFATPFTDATTGSTVLKIYSGIPGIKGGFRVYGGALQNKLVFPGMLATTQAIGTQWNVQVISAGRTRFTWIGGQDPHLGLIEMGNWVSIYGTPFNAANRGTYQIIDVQIPGSGNPYFDLNINGSTQATVTQVTANDITFQNANKLSIAAIGNYAAVIESGTTSRIRMPVVSQSVTRTEKSAWYVNGQPSIALNGAGTNERNAAGLVTLTTVTPHGLSVGRYVQLQNFRANVAAAPPANDTLTGVPVGLTAPDRPMQLPDGRILIINAPAGTPNAYYLYNPTTNVWALSPNAPPTDTVLNFGGNYVTSTKFNKIVGIFTSSIWIYDVATDQWAQATSFGSTVSDRQKGIALQNGNIFFCERLASGSAIAVIVNPSLGTITDITTNLNSGAPFSGQYRGALETGDGEIVLIGGVDYASAANPAIIGYIAAIGQWRVISSGAAVNASSSATAIFVPRGPRGEIWFFVQTGVPASNRIDIFDLHTAVLSESLTLPLSAVVGDMWLMYNGLVAFAYCDQDLVTYLGRVTIINPHPASSIVLTNTQAYTNEGFSQAGRFVRSNAGVTYYLGQSSTSFRLMNFLYDPLTAGQLSEQLKVTNVLSSTSFQVQSTVLWPTTVLSGEVVPILAELGLVQSGYILDTQGGVGIQSASTTLLTTTTPGYCPAVLSVVNASDFPDSEGYLVFGFGTEQQSKPIKYLGRASSTQLRIDPAAQFEYGYAIGTDITLLISRGVYNPDVTNNLGVTWLTASAVGRIEASNDLDDVIGTGLPIVKEIIYPNDIGLGNAGYPKSGTEKISDAVEVWGGDNVDQELEEARNA